MGRPPVVRRLDVRINGRLAGEYRTSPAGSVSFAYDADWLGGGEFAFPVSRQLPLMGGAQSGSHVNAVFENLLPDNTDLRRRIAERTEARSDRPHDLLAAIGQELHRRDAVPAAWRRSGRRGLVGRRNGCRCAALGISGPRGRTDHRACADPYDPADRPVRCRSD